MKAAKVIPVDRVREDALRLGIEEVVIRHRTAMEAEIAPQLNELSEIASMRPIMIGSETGYTYIYRPGAPPQ